MTPDSSHLQNMFRQAWNAVKDSLLLDSMPDADLAKRWWPTLVKLEPDYAMLEDNMKAMYLSPWMALLSIWAYGYAQALEDIDQERVYPEPQGGRKRLPDWLDEIIAEDVWQRYKDKH